MKSTKMIWVGFTIVVAAFLVVVFGYNAGQDMARKENSLRSGTSAPAIAVDAD